MIGALIGEVLSVGIRGRSPDWMRVSVHKVRPPVAGLGQESFRRLLAALYDLRLVERGGGYCGVAASMAQYGRTTRIRASTKLIGLCRRHPISPANALSHFSTEKKKPRTTPGLSEFTGRKVSLDQYLATTGPPPPQLNL